MDVDLKVEIPEPEEGVLSSQVVDEKPELRLNYTYIFFKERERERERARYIYIGLEFIMLAIQ